MVVESLTNGPPAKRLFVGLQIYGDQAIKLAAMSKEMSVQFTGAAGQRHLWEPDGTGHRHPLQSGGLDTVPYHITLRFLGPVDVSQEPALKAAVAAVADTLPPLMLCLYGCDTFPDRSGLYPKIAWVGVGGERHQLNLLERAVGKAINELGYSPPEYQFQPHITVGRFATDDRDWCLAKCRNTGAICRCRLPKRSESMKSYCTPPSATTTGRLLTSFKTDGG